MFLTHAQYYWVACGNNCYKDKLHIQNGDAENFYYYDYFFNLIHLRPSIVDWLVTSLPLQNTTLVMLEDNESDIILNCIQDIQDY